MENPNCKICNQHRDPRQRAFLNQFYKILGMAHGSIFREKIDEKKENELAREIYRFVNLWCPSFKDEDHA